MRQWRRNAGLAVAVLLPLLMGGCGPTPEELLAYEMVAVIAGLVLGLSMWAIGYRLGRRFFSRWFVCSHCLMPQTARVREEHLQVCLHCGQASSVNLLDAQTITAVLMERGQAAPRNSVWRWTILLTLATVCLLLAVSLVSFWLDLNPYQRFCLPEWLTFPLLFCVRTGLGLGYGLLFCSYQVIAVLGKALTAAGVPEEVGIIGGYVGTLLLIALHWYVGLRRWRRGWLLPVGLAVVNALAALIGYVLEVPVFK